VLAAAIELGALEMPASHAKHTGVLSTPLNSLIGVDRFIILIPLSPRQTCLGPWWLPSIHTKATKETSQCRSFVALRALCGSRFFGI